MSTAIADAAIEARTLINRDYISYSAISTYQRCPLSFFFRYVQQLPEETVAAALVFGSAIHSAAEFHFNELMADNPAPDLDTLLDVYQDAWLSREHDNINFGKTHDVNSLGQLAERMLAAFLKATLRYQAVKSSASRKNCGGTYCRVARISWRVWI